MTISNVVEPLVFLASLVAGSIIVGRIFPKRTSVTGTAHAGQSGMSPVFWGIPAGLITAIAVLLVINPPTVTRLSSS